jgi:endophilin-A
MIVPYSSSFHIYPNILKAQALVEFGDSLKQMADVKYALDDNVKQNFLEPLHQLQMKDLKEVMVSL